LIEAVGLTKRFGKRVAVDELSLSVPSGVIYGFLGPNGAGKTTTIRMLLGILPPDAGTVRVCGRPVRHRKRDLSSRRLIGAVSENQYLYDDMSVREYLRFFSALYRVGKGRVDVVLDEVGLGERAADLAVNLSKGLQQKLGLARALLHDPPVLILDEPVSGLDPHGIREVREIIVRERGRGRCIFLSSHVLSEVEQTADRVGILRHGRLILDEETSRIAARLGAGTSLEIELDALTEGLLDTIRGLPFVHEVSAHGARRLSVRLDDGSEARLQLSRTLSAGGSAILGMREHQVTLEEAFVTITDQAVDPIEEPELATGTSPNEH
jgi:ABC-2 type transport system ATP-binding protein